MKAKLRLLLQALYEPQRLPGWRLADWDLFVRQARRAGLLPGIALELESSGLVNQVPEQPRFHLESASIFYQAHLRSVKWEVGQINQALGKINLPVILLKGAAYTMLELPAGRGRIFNDVDILVPKDKLDNTEKIMRFHGWFAAKQDEYDQRYYRQWMHELPPLEHIKRKTVIDVHHTILPETTRVNLKAEKLFEAIQPVPGHDNVYTLSNEDMVLHSAAHLFFDGELENGFRDLVDLDRLLRDFGNKHDFWDRLVERAAELDLSKPLYYALHYCSQVLATPVPDVVMKAAGRLGEPSALMSPLMDALFSRALMPDHASCDDAFTPLARWLLYVRSHYLRMPLYLLLPHLLRKAIKRQTATPMEPREVEGEA
jgi:hypothetical protein